PMLVVPAEMKPPDVRVAAEAFDRGVLRHELEARSPGPSLVEEAGEPLRVRIRVRRRSAVRVRRLENDDALVAAIETLRCDRPRDLDRRAPRRRQERDEDGDGHFKPVPHGPIFSAFGPEPPSVVATKVSVFPASRRGNGTEVGHRSVWP